jgi:hypothetical protein
MIRPVKITIIAFDLAAAQHLGAWMPNQSTQTWP